VERLRGTIADGQRLLRIIVYHCCLSPIEKPVEQIQVFLYGSKMLFEFAVSGLWSTDKVMTFLPVSGSSLRVSALVLLFPVAKPKGRQIATDGIAVFALVKSRHDYDATSHHIDWIS
jgi:hypothetical protein